LDKERTGGDNSVWGIVQTSSATANDDKDRTNYAEKMFANLNAFKS